MAAVQAHICRGQSLFGAWGMFLTLSLPSTDPQAAVARAQVPGSRAATATKVQLLLEQRRVQQAQAALEAAQTASTCGHTGTAARGAVERGAARRGAGLGSTRVKREGDVKASRSTTEVPLPLQQIES